MTGESTKTFKKNNNTSEAYHPGQCRKAVEWRNDARRIHVFVAHGTQRHLDGNEREDLGTKGSLARKHAFTEKKNNLKRNKQADTQPATKSQHPNPP